MQTELKASPQVRRKSQVSAGARSLQGVGGREINVLIPDFQVRGSSGRCGNTLWRCIKLFLISFQAAEPTTLPLLVTLAFYFSRDEFLIFMTVWGKFQSISTQPSSNVLCIWSNSQGLQTGQYSPQKEMKVGFSGLLK